MNTNALAVVLVSVVVCSVVGGGVGPRSDAMDTPTEESMVDESLGGDISAFMQRGAAGANASVDSGMWLAAFETAENQSRKRALVSQRAVVLSARLDHLETRIERFSPPATNRSIGTRMQWVRLAADHDALQTSITEAKTTAASEGVNASGLDRLGRRAANLTVPDPADRTQSTADGGTNTALADRDGTDIAVEDPRTAGMTYGGP